MNVSGLSQHIKGLAHVGFVVTNLAKALTYAKVLYGVSDEDIRIVPPLNDDTAQTRFGFVRVADGIEFEFIEPLSEGFKQQLLSIVSGPAGINHLAYWVQDIDAALSDLAVKNIRPGYVTPNGPVHTGRQRMVYLDPNTTGGALIELIELSSTAKHA